MGWFLRSSKNGVHVVYGQQSDASCGIACVIMVNFKMKKGQLAAAAASVPGGGVFSVPVVAGAFAGAVKSEEEVDAAYAKVSGQPYTGSTYTYADVLPKVLNKLNIGTWTSKCVPATQVADTIISRAGSNTPCITLVHWRAGGGHFVVCDNVVRTGNGTEADFCDPWDAAVRTISLRPGQSILYQSAAVNQPGLDLGQHKSYASCSTADMDGWIVYQTAA